MKIPISWIKQYIDYEISNEKVAELLTMAGTEVSAIQKIGEDWDENIIVGKIINIQKHPNADRLSLVEVDTSIEIINVVCGANNIQVGQKIALAKPGATLYNPYEKKISTLKKSKIRGIESNGMICSALELGYSEDHNGILVLDQSFESGKSLKSLLYDEIFDLDLTPNRSDCLSVIGIVREIAAILNAQNIKHKLIKQINFETTNSNSNYSENNDFKVKIIDKECNRYTGLSIDNFNVKESPFWIKDKLIKSGLRPISNMVDLTNFIMLEYGQPMHAFDITKIKSNKIEIKKNHSKLNFIALDQENRILKENMLMITDGENPIGLAGVIGGQNTEIDTKTSSIFLESASFDMSNIRQTSKNLNLSTDASYRFERGVPTQMTLHAINRAIELIQDEKNQNINITGFWDEYSKLYKEQTKTVIFTNTRYKKIIGQDISVKDAKSIFLSLGFKINIENENKSDFSIELSIPFWRNDIELEDDLIEEIARIIGYDNLDSSPMQYPLNNVPVDPSINIKNDLRHTMRSMGYTEVINYPVIDKTEHTTLKNNNQNDAIELKNPINQKKKYMRSNLRSGLIDNLSKNAKKYSDIESWKFFELGRTYSTNIDNKFKLPSQDYSLGIIAFGNTENTNWSQQPTKIDFYVFKGYIEKIFSNLNIKFELSKILENDFYTNQSANITVKDQEVGSFGYINDNKLNELNSKISDVLYAEIFLERLLIHQKVNKKYKKTSAYPHAIRDLSFIMENKIYSNDIINIINTNPLISDIKIVDVYDLKNENKKSITFRLSYQSFNETLSNEKIEESQNKTLKLLKQKLNIELRKQS